MFLKRSRWWLRKEQLSRCRSITSCNSQCYSPSSSCSISVALHLHLPCMSLIAGHLSHFPHCLSPNFLIPYLHCLFLCNHRSLLLNYKPQTIHIHEGGHSSTAPIHMYSEQRDKSHLTHHRALPPHATGYRGPVSSKVSLQIWLLPSNDRTCFT